MGKQFIKYDMATCPHCLNSYEHKELERQTEYGCWATEEESVECPDCEEAFTVRCVHRGFEPDNNFFDFQTWLNAWGLKIPSHRIFVEHYLKQQLEDGEMRLTVMDGQYADSNPNWAEAFEIAKPLWNEFMEKKAAKEAE